MIIFLITVYMSLMHLVDLFNEKNIISIRFTFSRWHEFPITNDDAYSVVNAAYKGLIPIRKFPYVGRRIFSFQWFHSWHLLAEYLRKEIEGNQLKEWLVPDPESEVKAAFCAKCKRTIHLGTNRFEVVVVNLFEGTKTLKCSLKRQQKWNCTIF